MATEGASQSTIDRGETEKRIQNLKQEIESRRSEIKNLEVELTQQAESCYASEISNLKEQSRNVTIALGIVVAVSVFATMGVLFSGRITEELRRCLLSLTSGVLGSTMSAFLSSLDRRAHGWEVYGVKIPAGEEERFNENMVPFFFGRPLLGFLTGLLVYSASMAEVLFKPEGAPDPTKAIYRIVFYSLLAGLFAKSLLDKLKDIFDYVFGA